MPGTPTSEAGTDAVERYYQTWLANIYGTGIAEYVPARRLATRNNSFFGIDRSFAPRRREQADLYRERDRIREYYTTYNPDLRWWVDEAPRPVLTYDQFVNNWAQIGQQHERKVFCQPLLGA